MRLMVLYTFSIFGHFIMTFSGYYVGFNLGRSLSGGYMIRLAGMGIVDPVYTTISQRCFHITPPPPPPPPPARPHAVPGVLNNSAGHRGHSGIPHRRAGATVMRPAWLAADIFALEGRLER